MDVTLAAAARPDDMEIIRAREKNGMILEWPMSDFA